MNCRRDLIIQLVVFMFMLALVLPEPAKAVTTYYVDPNGSADSTGIQAAIDASSNGDEIKVATGTYNEAIDFNGKAIRLYSSDPNDPNIVAATIIDGTGYYHVVQCINFEGPNTIMEGFTITGGNANGSGSNAYGGGMYCSASNPTVADCNFTGNQAGRGGGMYNTNDSDPNIINCTFNGNDATNGGGIYNVAGSPTLTNCILWGDSPDEIYGGSPIVTYSAIQGGFSGEGNMDQNPLLRNIDGGDLSLAPWSPCIDAGNNDVVAGITTDITGQPRLVDGDCNTTETVDMGAHEFRHGYGGDFDSSCLVNMADYAFLTWAWLASPQSGNWAPVCDISIPADGHIDAGDVKVLAGNWLGSIDTPVTCDATGSRMNLGLMPYVPRCSKSGAMCVFAQRCGSGPVRCGIQCGRCLSGTYTGLRDDRWLSD